MDSDKEARIRQRAYEIWQREGRPHGRDAEHWQQAEAEIMAEAAVAADRDSDRAAADRKAQGEPPTPETAPLRSRRAAAKPEGGQSSERAEGSRPSASPRRGRKPTGP